MIPRPVEAVVFDMDGLLIDSERALLRTMQEIAPSFGVEISEDFFRTLIGLPLPASSAILMQTFGEDFPLEDFLVRLRVRNRELNAAGICLKDGVVELLDLLDDLGLPRAICTSSAHETVTHHLGFHGLVERFDAIVARGDYAHGKPHPEPFRTAAARLGAEPRACLALEDSHNGVRAAHAAGMQVVMVPDMLAPTAEMRGLCIHVADTLHAAARLLTDYRDGPPLK
jgi:HAD superfamily hydrolase (TIGR01509 family)